MKPPTACPHCHRDLATNQRGKHCGDTSPTCTWLKCSCGAVIDTRHGAHLHSKDVGPADTWPCNTRRPA